MSAPPEIARPQPVAPSEDDVPPEHREKHMEARRRLTAMEDENYFQMLGVDVGAPNDEVRSAFLAGASRWHPDRAPANVSAIRDLYARIFAYLSEAQDVLTRDDARSRYLGSVHEGGGTPSSQRKIAALIEAATDAQKAEVCLRRRDFDDAERFARKTLAVATEDPNAMLVLAAALSERKPDGPHDEAINLLTRAVQIAPKHDRAHVLLGSLHKRRGDARKAHEHFRLAVEANPRNTDASREIRLAQMRKRDGTGPHAAVESTSDKPKEGLFSKLLKK